MKRKVLYLVMTVVVVVSLMAGCGSKSTGSDIAMPAGALGGAPSESQSAGKADMGNGAAYGTEVSVTSESKAAEEPAKAEDEITGIAATGTEGSDMLNTILSQRKIIRNANVTILVDNFDFTYGKIQTLVEHSGYGYISQSKVDKQSALTKSGMVVVRVQSDKFSDILNSIKGLGEVINGSENTEDVTEKFYDVESQLRLLKYEQSRLEEYLVKLTKPEDIFKTEDKLTEIRHQIESLTGTLNKLSDLVKLSTITINITEKEPDSEKKAKEEASYWNRLSGGFGDSVKGVVSFFAALLLFLVQALPVLILLALLGWIAFIIYRRISKNNKSRRDADAGKEIPDKKDDAQL